MRQPFGQNYLIDRNMAEKIVRAAAVSAKDDIIEIGPGHGVLSSLIVSQTHSLTMVEIDADLARGLKRRFRGFENVEVLHQDFMEYSLPAAPFKVIANLPYYLATAIIRSILPSAHWEALVLMVQKEVAERITALPGNRTYGAFSLVCGYYAEVSIAFHVPPSCFRPRPKVTSSVLVFRNRRPEPPDPALFAVIHAAFQQRRKTILNSLAGTLTVSKAQMAKLLETALIGPEKRPENLTLQEYILLTSLVKKYIIQQERI